MREDLGSFFGPALSEDPLVFWLCFFRWTSRLHYHASLGIESAHGGRAQVPLSIFTLRFSYYTTF